MEEMDVVNRRQLDYKIKIQIVRYVTYLIIKLQDQMNMKTMEL